MTLIQPSDLFQRLHAVHGAAVGHRDDFRIRTPLLHSPQSLGKKCTLCSSFFSAVFIGFSGILPCRPELRNGTEYVLVHCLQKPADALFAGCQIRTDEKSIFRAHQAQSCVGRMGISGMGRKLGRKLQTGDKRPVLSDHLPRPVIGIIVHDDDIGNIIPPAQGRQASVQILPAVSGRQNCCDFVHELSCISIFVL